MWRRSFLCILKVCLLGFIESYLRRLAIEKTGMGDRLGSRLLLQVKKFLHILILTRISRVRWLIIGRIRQRKSSKNGIDELAFIAYNFKE